MIQVLHQAESRYFSILFKRSSCSYYTSIDQVGGWASTKFLRKLHQWQVGANPRGLNHHVPMAFFRNLRLPLRHTKYYGNESFGKWLVSKTFPPPRQKTQDPPRISSQILWFQGIKNPTNSIKFRYPSLKLTARTWKWMNFKYGVCPFSGAKKNLRFG